MVFTPSSLGPASGRRGWQEAGTQGLVGLAASTPLLTPGPPTGTSALGEQVSRVLSTAESVI